MTAFWRSLKLAAVRARADDPAEHRGRHLRRPPTGKLADRTVVTLGLASSSIPEFVSCVILQA